MARTVADFIVETVHRAGAEHVFGVAGDALNPLTDAIRRHDEVSWIGCRHEEAGAFAAGAQAQLDGRLGVCAGTVGPGALHLINGLYDAAKSHAPMLAIAGQVPLADMGTNYFQEVNFERLFSDVACYSHTVTDPAQLPRALAEGVGAARSSPGVAVLTLPADMGGRDVPGDPDVPSLLEPAGPVTPDPEAITEAARMIDDAERVTILAGIGARDARDDVIRLAQHLSAPMVVTLKGKEVFDGPDNRFHLGLTGLLGNPVAADALESADLVLMIGTDFPYHEWYPDTPLVQVDVAADHIGRRATVAHGVVASASLATGALLHATEFKESTAHLDRLRDEYLGWQKRQTKFADPDYEDTVTGSVRGSLDNPEGRIRPEALAAIIGELADDDAVFTADTGMSVVWMSRFIDLGGERRAIGSFNHGSMASAMPQAIGAQLADPGRQVIGLCGDGGFTMLLGDLMTAVTHRLPIKLFVFDNGRYGMVKLEQEQAGLPEFGTKLDNPDLAAVAESMGAAGFRVTDPHDLRKVVAEALAHPGPAVVDVITNPNEVALPPEVTASDVWGFSIAKLKEFVTSRGDGPKGAA